MFFFTSFRFLHAAKNYQFKDKTFEELCEHNAQISLAYDKFNTYKDWMILKTLFKIESAPKFDTLAASYPRTTFNVHSASSVATPVNIPTTSQY